MSFKIYKNKITGHASVSLKHKDKKHWCNLPMSHSKPKDSYVKVNDPHPKADKKHIVIFANMCVKTKEVQEIIYTRTIGLIQTLN